MRINIDLQKPAIDKLLAKYGYKRTSIRVGYTFYSYEDEELVNHMECVSYYTAEIAYPIGDKPKELTAGLVTPSIVKPYLLENVVETLFNMLLVEKLL